MEKRVTMATVKSFVQKHFGNIWIKNRHTFDSMTDGTRYCENVWRKAEIENTCLEHNFGIRGAWFNANNRVYAYSDQTFIGFHIYNNTDSFDIGVKKEQLIKDIKNKPRKKLIIRFEPEYTSALNLDYELDRIKTEEKFSTFLYWEFKNQIEEQAKRAFLNNQNRHNFMGILEDEGKISVIYFAYSNMMKKRIYFAFPATIENI